jgi:hypothetical protein
MLQSSIPLTAQLIFFYLGSSISLISGIALLKRQNWARFLYIGWGGISFIISLAISSLRYLSLPGLVLFMAIAFFLFRGKANQYFGPGQIPPNNEIDITQTPAKQNIFVFLLRIIFNSISAILFGMGNMMAFLNDEKVIGVVILFMALGFIFLLIGLLLNRFQKWKRDMGIVSIAGACYAAFMVAIMILISLSPEFQKSFQIPPDFSLDDYSTGASFVVLFAVVGFVLLKLQKSNPTIQ